MDTLLPVLNLSQHAILRMAQRNISLADVQYVLEHGERLHRTGITIYMLRKRDIPHNDRKESELMRLEGTVVLAGSSQNGKLEIITAYRNKGAFRTLRYKKKYDNRGKHRADRNPPPDRG